MTKESFLASCDENGKAPLWAVFELCEAQSKDDNEWNAHAGDNWDDSAALIEWLGI